MERRLQMLSQVEKQFAIARASQAAVDHKAVYAKTLRMMNSHYQDSFNLEREPAEVRDAYGRGSFGSGCLMARRLVEQGVTYVEVSLDGWDTHANNFDALSRRLLPELDKGMSALVADLAERRLLDTTTIVWMGEFGRTPRINQNAGRDHWPRSWSVVVGGGGMKGGQVVGATDKDGIDIVDRPVGVMDLIATMTKTMGINARRPSTRPRAAGRSRSSTAASRSRSWSARDWLVRVTGRVCLGPWRNISFHTAARNNSPTMIAANQSMAFTVLEIGEAGVSRR